MMRIFNEHLGAFVTVGLDLADSAVGVEEKKPPLGMVPRDFWLIKRIQDALEAMSHCNEWEDWVQYREQVKRFSEEILYCVTEWEKFYPAKKNTKSD